MRQIDVSAGGVYRIKCKSTQRVYIGSASVFIVRIASHIHLLNGGSHPNKEMQADWLRYGKDDFEFHIVKVMSNRWEYLALERELIAGQVLRRPMPYNICWKALVKREKKKRRLETAKAKRDAALTGSSVGNAPFTCSAALTVYEQTNWNR